MNWGSRNIRPKCLCETKAHAWEVLLYGAGFPCAPFSSLHWQSLLLQEAAAKPMYRVLDNLAACAAPAPWLICKNHVYQKNLSGILVSKLERHPFETLRLAFWRTSKDSKRWNVSLRSFWRRSCLGTMIQNNNYCYMFVGDAWRMWTWRLHVPLFLGFRYQCAYLDLNACLGSLASFE